MPSQPNIALVVLDTLRKDHFDKHFDWLNGRKFELAWSPSHCTPPVHAAIFSGRYPREIGVYAEKDILGDEYPVIAEFLSKNGYSTRGFSANPLISPTFEFNRGFDDFTMAWPVRDAANDSFDWHDFLSKHRGISRYPKALVEIIKSSSSIIPSLVHGMYLQLHSLGISPYDDDGSKKCLQYLKSNTPSSEPSFQFINLMEAHSPYRPPSEYRTVNDYYYPDAIRATFDRNIQRQIDREKIIQSYDDSTRYLSDQYKKIFNQLKEDYDVIITTSDHGELFGSDSVDGLWGHFHGIYPPLTHVPLVISGDSITEDSVTEPVSLIDIFSTILELVEYNNGPDLPNSQSLLSHPFRKQSFTETQGISDMQLSKFDGDDSSILDKIVKYDQQFAGIVSQNYYGYETPSKFREIGNPPFASPKSELDKIIQDLSFRDSREGEVNDQLETHLEDLGYM